MEKRAILAAVLMAALLIIYQTCRGGQGEPPPKPETKAPPTSEAPAPQPTPVPPPARSSDRPPEAQPPAPRPAQRTARVEGPSFAPAVNSEECKRQELNLRYRGDKAMVVVGSLGPTGLTVGTGTTREIVPLELQDESVTLGA